MKDDRNERAAHVRLVEQVACAEARREQAAQESATVIAYRNGEAFGRRQEWADARTWWLTVGITTGFIGGAALVVLAFVLGNVPPVL